MGVGGVVYWASKAKKRLAMIDERCPSDRADGALVAGGPPVVSAINERANEIADPLASELGVIADEAAYGRDVSESIRAMAEASKARICAFWRSPSASNRPRAATWPRSCRACPR